MSICASEQYVSDRWQNNGATNVIEVPIWKWTDDKIMVQLMSLKCQYVSEQMTK